MRRLGHRMFSFIPAIISPFSSFASTAKITLAMLVLTTGLFATPGEGPRDAAQIVASIPKDAIRIRIIANSDSSFDQKVKADVRDHVADVIRSWGAMPGTHDEARALIQLHLSEVTATANSSLQQWGVSYTAVTELAEVPFPDKVFDGRTYSSGNYEALRITLGGGKGANWWCVLFPPLCLTAATKADDKPRKQNSIASTAKEAQVKPVKGMINTSGNMQTAGPIQAADEGKPEARSFVWEMLKGLVNFFQSLFS
jgi:stage II sporulation protein R